MFFVFIPAVKIAQFPLMFPWMECFFFFFLSSPFRTKAEENQFKQDAERFQNTVLIKSALPPIFLRLSSEPPPQTWQLMTKENQQ